ncbi:SRPBCC family protein [Nocardioides sp. LML1-1-1.1]|uniref:SRPBCC family protein n=1 Tax=Nocardioides sp. LML1-1-1.1 TaxID=3135248 RepID=UPI003443A964
MDLHDHVTIAASPATVWALVGDLTRMAEWSPQVDSTRLSDAGTTAEGTRFTNRNVHGELAWITHGEVVRHEPERHLAFRIEENWAVWSFALEPAADGGTVLHQRRTTPEGISPLSLELTEGYLGGLDAFTDTLRTGMRTTLAGIKASAEGAPR